mmetsp:Transcript_3083/g.5048  ORF Transcript_3083/g.5048 Transcript_3083/m.5048 type:complete len:236 (+) Transcript_3083:545-1252(+)
MVAMSHLRRVGQVRLMGGRRGGDWGRAGEEAGAVEGEEDDDDDDDDGDDDVGSLDALLLSSPSPVWSLPLSSSFFSSSFSFSFSSFSFCPSSSFLSPSSFSPRNSPSSFTCPASRNSPASFTPTSIFRASLANNLRNRISATSFRCKISPRQTKACKVVFSRLGPPAMRCARATFRIRNSVSGFWDPMAWSSRETRICSSSRSSLSKVESRESGSTTNGRINRKSAPAFSALSTP